MPDLLTETPPRPLADLVAGVAASRGMRSVEWLIEAGLAQSTAYQVLQGKRIGRLACRLISLHSGLPLGQVEAAAADQPGLQPTRGGAA